MWKNDKKKFWGKDCKNVVILLTLICCPSSFSPVSKMKRVIFLKHDNAVSQLKTRQWLSMVPRIIDDLLQMVENPTWKCPSTFPWALCVTLLISPNVGILQHFKYSYSIIPSQSEQNALLLYLLPILSIFYVSARTFFSEMA